MKKMRKTIVAWMMLCVLFCGSLLTVHAATAELWFSDPSAKVGDEVEVEANLGSSSNISSANIKLNYDTSMLKFISGDQTTGGDGNLTITGSGSSSKLTFRLKFQALKEGSAKIEVSSSEAKDTSGATMQITDGNSTVTIAAGDPSKIKEDKETSTSKASGDGPKVEVDGTSYNISNDFSDSIIPQGFTKGEMSYEGETCQVVTQEASGLSAFYLTPVDGGDSDFFLYDKEKGSFQPFEQVLLSQERYIVLLRNDGSVKLSKNYQETTLTLNGKDFAAWQNMDEPDYYVVYALNSDGNKGLYRYDTVDETYQRYTAPTADSSQETKTARTGLLGKVLDFVENHLKLVGIGVAALFALLLLLLLVVAVKLRHRNLELDDLYDEYGIDMEEEPKEALETPARETVGGKALGPAVRRPVKGEFKEDDFEDFAEMDEFTEDDFAEEEDPEDKFKTEAYPPYENYDEEDEMIDDLDDLLSNQPKKKRGHMEDDDTFKVDFVDLD